MEHPAPKPRVAVVLEALLSVAAAGLVLAVLHDALLVEFNEWSARLEHGLSVAVVAPLRLAVQVGLLGTDWTTWHDLAAPALAVAFVAAVLTAAAALLDPPPGTPHTRARKMMGVPFALAIGIPSLLATLVAILFGALLAPAVFGAIFAVTVAGSLLGRRCRRAEIAHEQSISGLPPAFWPADHGMRFALLLLGLEALLVGAALAMSDSNALLLSLLGSLERGGTMGPALFGHGLTVTTIVLLLAAPLTRRTLGTLTWEPWAAGLSGLLALGALMSGTGGWWELRIGAPMGFAAGVAGCLLAAAGMPTLPRMAAHPLRSVGRLFAPLLAALMATGYALSTGFLGCATIAADPRIETLARTPSAGAVAWVDSPVEAGAFFTLPGESSVGRVGIPSGTTRLIDLRALPLDALRVSPAARGEGPQTEGGLPTVVPGPIGVSGDGRPFLLYHLADGTVSGVVELDPDSAAPIGFTEELGECPPTSWAWHPLLGLGVIGCLDTPELSLFEPSLGRSIARTPLAATQGLGSTGVDPRSGALLALAPGRSPFVLRLDVQSGSPRGWRFLGMANRALAVDPTGMAHIPRFLSRSVLSMDAQALGPVLVARSGLGGAAVAVSRTHARVLTASTLDGYLYASRPGETAAPERIRVGGMVRDLAVSGDGSTAIVAGFCGVLAVDLDRWLGGN